MQTLGEFQLCLSGKVCKVFYRSFYDALVCQPSAVDFNNIWTKGAHLKKNFPKKETFIKFANLLGRRLLETGQDGTFE